MHGQQCFTSRIAAEKYLSVALVSNTLNLDLFATHGGELEKGKVKGKERKRRQEVYFFLFCTFILKKIYLKGPGTQHSKLN